jgi:hypothetical protein
MREITVGDVDRRQVLDMRYHLGLVPLRSAIHGV